MEVINTVQNEILQPLSDFEPISIKKATPKDICGIYSVACSVGSKTKESHSGFLMDDYASRPKYYQRFFLEKIMELDHFYVAENQMGIIGFLMAYTKEQWLRYNPIWIDEIKWSPDFDFKKLESFILIDKTAILAGMTGKGIGSKLYKALFRDIEVKGIQYVFAETIISPTPNLSSLAFREKQKYDLAGVRYEIYLDTLYTDLIYYKTVNKK